MRRHKDWAATPVSDLLRAGGTASDESPCPFRDAGLQFVIWKTRLPFWHKHKHTNKHKRGCKHTLTHTHPRTQTRNRIFFKWVIMYSTKGLLLTDPIYSTWHNIRECLLKIKNLYSVFVAQWKSTDLVNQWKWVWTTLGLTKSDLCLFARDLPKSLYVNGTKIMRHHSCFCQSSP